MVTRETSSKSLVLVLGDQLSPGISSLRNAEKDRDVILMVEVEAAARRVRYHKKKLGFIFSAMRHYAEELEQLGWMVDYVRLNDQQNVGSLTEELRRAIARHKPVRIALTEPGMWALRKSAEEWSEMFDIPVDMIRDNRFVCSRETFEEWFKDRKQPRMEHFYRHMRRATGLLMDDDQPTGGRWNFDSENRKKASKSLSFSGPKRFAPDKTTRAVLSLVQERFSDHFGELEPFWFAVTRAQAEEAFEHFLDTSLAQFGDYQDAMLQDERFLFHGVISLYLNVGLLDPMDVCRRVDTAFREGHVPLNAAEGFIRQIIGWREYVRGLYWFHMPDYMNSNFLGHDRPLPASYWTAETDMACLRACITQTAEEAYAHHIQRLMVTGNFAMLAGVDPKAVHEWYLSVYADAYEWVELPNTIGMSQFADGGLLGSKPYASSGNYINRMSDYCSACRYDVKLKNGPSACPFNYLYWDFMDRHRQRLASNARLGPVYRTWDRMSDERKKATRKDAKEFLKSLNRPQNTQQKEKAGLLSRAR